MEFFNSWLQGIIISTVIATIIEMILPDSSNNKKYIKIVLGVYVVFNIITPIINKLSQNDFEISSIINIEKYTKEFNSYQVNTEDIDIENINKSNIENIYINNMKKDMKTKIEEKGYIVNDIKVELENNDEYTVKELIININKKNKQSSEENENKKNEENTKIVNEIKTININIKDENINTNETVKSSEENKKQLSNKEKSEILNYIVSIYEIKENRIIIN